MQSMCKPDLSPLLWVMLFAVALQTGCGEADFPVADTRPDGSSLTSEDREGAEFVQSRLAEIWVRGEDGWTTELQQRNMLGEVMGGVPVVLYRQYAELAFSVKPEPLTDAMVRNGTDYRAVIEFTDASVRYFRTQSNWEGPKGWSPWKDEMLRFRGIVIERRNGKWLMSDDELFDGVLPDPGAVKAAPDVYL